MALIQLQETPIHCSELYEQLKEKEYGGIVTFVGTIREWTGDTQTKQICYSAYEEMALKEMHALAAKIEAHGAKVIIVHRLGLLELTDEAVFIGVASPHRSEAFRWCQFLIDELKKTVPIWKKEINTHTVNWGGHRT